MVISHDFRKVEAKLFQADQRRPLGPVSVHTGDGDASMSEPGGRRLSLTVEQYQRDGCHFLPQCADVFESRGGKKSRSPTLSMSYGRRLAFRKSERGLAKSVFAVLGDEFPRCDRLPERSSSVSQRRERLPELLFPGNSFASADCRCDSPETCFRSSQIRGAAGAGCF